jgi:hypothetical protein
MGLISGLALGLGSLAAGAYGASQQASAQRDATNAAIEAAQFRPFDISLPGTNATFDVETGQASVDSNLSGVQNLLEMQIMNALNPAGQQARGFGFLPGIMRNSAQQLAGMDPNADLNAALGLTQGALGGLQSDLTGINLGLSQLGTQAGMLPGQVMGTANAASLLDPSSQFAINQGQGMLSGLDLQGQVDETLNLLRTQARPAEERAVDSALQDLFSTGQLSSTSGARALGELSLAQENADITRQLQAQQVGQQQFQLQQQAGQGLLGLGQSGLATGRQLQQGLAGLQGQTGLSALGTQSGLLGQQAGLSGSLFDATGVLANQQINRGQQRLANLQNLFGFGQQAEGNALQQGLAGLTGQLQINQDLRNAIALGGNIGGQQQVASGQIANAILSNAGSPLGSFLGEAGIGGLTGLFSSSIIGGGG